MKPGSSKPMSEKLKKYTVDPVTGCWNWYGSKDYCGYGRIMLMSYGVREFKFAHRCAFEFHVRLLENGEHVCHHCDNPGCVNPDHLYAGNPKTNGNDKKVRGRAKGTQLFGKDNPMYGRTGDKNPFFGRKHTDETKAKISLVNRK